MVCGFLLRRFAVLRVARERVIMGAVASALLMAAKLAISVFLLNRSVAEHFLTYREFSHALGLAAQAAFAVIPLLQMRFPSSEGASP